MNVVESPVEVGVAEDLDEVADTLDRVEEDGPRITMTWKSILTPLAN